MFLSHFSRLRYPVSTRNLIMQIKKCHSVFGIKDLIYQEKPDNFIVTQVTSDHHEMALDMVKQYYLPEHVLVRSRNMDIHNDRALDEYIVGLLKQGNSLFAKSEDGSVVGLCVGFASCPVDPRNLRNYAFYRQDPNIKDFLYFTAKMQETPNLWDIFKQSKVFEIKMITVVPEFRRQGLAVLMSEHMMEQAHDQGYNVIRMDCINIHDYKIAERCMLQCIVKYPLHKLRGPNAPFIKRSSEHNALVRVYVTTRAHNDETDTSMKKLSDLELLID